MGRLFRFGPSLALFCFRAPDPESENRQGDDSSRDDLRNGKEKAAVKEKLLEANGGSPAQAPSKRTPKRKGLALVDRHAERGEDGKVDVPSSFKSKVDDFVTTISSVLKQPIYAGTVCYKGGVYLHYLNTAI